MNISFNNKIVIITGGASGIGRSISNNFRQRGATVLVLDYDENKVNAINDYDDKYFKAYLVDITDIQQVKNIINKIQNKYLKIDILVNNAGLNLINKFEDVDEDDFYKVINTNLKGTYFCTQEVVKYMILEKSGRIINIASRAAFRGDTVEYLAYAASKAGVVSLSKSIARAFGKDGITCFVVAPGWVKTDMADESIEKYGDEYILQGNSLDRLTEPEDIAPIVTLLTSGLADHATGTTIDINAASYVH